MRTVHLCALAFVLLLTYGLVRPPVESLFLERYGSALLPAAWTTVAAAAALSVAIYNWLAARMNLRALFVTSSLFNALLLLLLSWAVERKVAGAAFVLYVWKDIYVVVMLENLWSWAHVTFRFQTARWAYGLFCAAGSAGGIVGNLVIGALAVSQGTVFSLFGGLPFFVLMVLIALAARGQDVKSSFVEASSKLKLTTLAATPRRYLLLLAALVVLVQLVVTWVDFVYNRHLELAFSQVDRRTAVTGQVYAAIDVLAFALQVGTGFLVRRFGLTVILMSVPTMILASLAAALAAPQFLLMANLKLFTKSLVYSLFRAGKEMLYLPLDYAAKTRAKALIDMFGYRAAKGAASLALLLVLAQLSSAVVLMAIACGVLVWGWLSLWLTRYARSMREA